MSTDKLLALHRFAAQWHGGQDSQGYRILSRTSMRLRARGISHPLDTKLPPRAAGIYGGLTVKWIGRARMRWF